MNKSLCLKCKGQAFDVKTISFTLEIKKESLSISCPCEVCKNCKEPLLNADRISLIRKAAADLYRKEHGLLTSEEIISFREKLGMSQTAFAQFLNVGEASVKRWETGHVQDASQNDHIRVKCDEIYCESQYLYLLCKYGETDIYSGLKMFSASLFKQVYQYFTKHLTQCFPTLDKLFFYSDFLHFKRHGVCITGLRYTPSKSGPSPHNHHLLQNFAHTEQFSQLTKKTHSLSESESQALKDVCKLFLVDNGKSLRELSLKEKGFLATQDIEFISYEYARDLLI